MQFHDWPRLLSESMSVLGPYAGEPPPLNTFAPHSWRSDFGHVALAGQFLQLPKNPSGKWLYGETYRAYAVFEFSEVRSLSSSGVPVASSEDDSIHGVPVGKVAECSLIELNDVVFENPELGTKLKWKAFTLRQPTFSLQIEATTVTLYLGQHASHQYGWSR